MNTAQIPLPKEKLAYWAKHFGDREVLHQPMEGKYLAFTWTQIEDEAYRLAAFLKKQGCVKGDNVAILAKNCAHWVIADLALMLGGFVSIPIYPTANAETISFILEHAECKAIIVGKLDNLEAASNAIPAGISRIGMPYPTVEVDHQWRDIMKSHESDRDTVQVEGSDLMTILYTSGSTGQPKGAMHSYNNFVNAGRNTGAAIDITLDDRLLSYLPMSHCTERNYVSSVFLNYGPSLYFVESIASFANDMAYCAPTLFGSVPRLWTQFQKKILTKLPNKKLQTLLKIPIINRVVKSKIKKQMGFGNTRGFVSGSAPLSVKVLEWYRSIGIEIAEGWGMTETFACGSLPHDSAGVLFSTVSQVGLEVDIKIAEDQEVLIRSTSAMMGYYKDEEKTKEILNDDGFFLTGDLGKLENGYLSITGRKKDIFKTEKGKYVAPIPIESEYGDNEYIEQMCLMGTQLVQPVLVVNISDHAKGLEQDLVHKNLQATMIAINEKLESHEKVGGIVVTHSDWTTESGELTPTLKVKRHVVEKQYLDTAKQVKPGEVVWQ